MRKLFFAIVLSLLLPMSGFAASGDRVIEGRMADSISTAGLKLDQNVETLAAAKTLVVTDLLIQKLDPNGSDRNVTLPAEASSTDLVFWIYNTANGSGEDLTVRDDSPATIGTLGPGMGMMFSCDGTSWVALDNEGILYDAEADTVTVMRNVGIGVDPSYPLHIKMDATDLTGLYIDGDSNDYTGDGVGIAFSVKRDVFQTAITNQAGQSNYLNLKHTAGQTGGGAGNINYIYANINRVDNNASIINNTAHNDIYHEYGTYSWIDAKGGVYDLQAAGDLEVVITGVESYVETTDSGVTEQLDLSDTGSAGGVGSLEVTGVHARMFHGPDVLSGTWTMDVTGFDATIRSEPELTGGTIVQNTNGLLIDIDASDVGTSTAKGINITAVAGADTNYAIYDNTSAGWYSKSALTIVTTAEPAISITMTGITGTDSQAIDITGGEALGSEEHWTGIRIKPDDLDPGGADTRIRGMAINLSGVDTTNIPEDMTALRLVMPSGLTGQVRDNVSALSIVDGDIDHSFIVPATGGSEFTAYDFVLNVGDLVSTSEVHAIDVVAVGSPAGNVAGLAVHLNVDPIHQHIDSYSSPSQTEYAGRKTTGGTVWADGIDAVEIFVVNSDAIYLGAAAQFSSIDVTMSSAATKTVSPTFWYNTAADTWTQFFPNDNTNGFQQSAPITWSIGGISATWTGDGDPGAGDTTAGYWIKIVRTGGPDPGTPTASNMDTGTATCYHWDKDGDLSVNSVTSAGITTQSYEAVSSTSDGVALSVTKGISNVTTNNDGDTDSVTLANGTAGQTKTVVLEVLTGADTGLDITPATFSQGTKVTLNAAGQNAVFLYNAVLGWILVSTYGGIIS